MTRTLIPMLVATTLALAAPASYQLSGARHEYQRFNNCGPVTIGMALSFFGDSKNQYFIAPILKPNKQDKNVNPEEMVAYARSRGYQVHLGVAGNLSLLKQLIAAGFPVIAESGFVVAEHGWMGHYRLLLGYDDSAGRFRAYDSYFGPKVTLKYGEFDSVWQHFNRTYLVVYPSSKAAQVEAILGERMRAGNEWRRALEVAQTETSSGSVYAWFNLGMAQLELGQIEAAARSFDRARAIGWPWRMLWYQFGPFEAYYRLGRYNDVIALANGVLAKVADLEEALYWRGKARVALGQVSSGRADLQAALRYRPSYKAAREELNRL
jgi:tetratricopeptide (TPR) repeat protein